MLSFSLIHKCTTDTLETPVGSQTGGFMSVANSWQENRVRQSCGRGQGRGLLHFLLRSETVCAHRVFVSADLHLKSRTVGIEITDVSFPYQSAHDTLRYGSSCTPQICHHTAGAERVALLGGRRTLLKETEATR